MNSRSEPGRWPRIFPDETVAPSGLSGGILVVEAAAKIPGSLITARTAIDQGRDVFCDSRFHRFSLVERGCSNALIRQGAKLVETSQDVLEELKHYNPVANSQADRREPESAALTEEYCLPDRNSDPVDTDTLCERCRLDAATLKWSQSLELEAGRRNRMPAGEGCIRRLVSSV